MTIGLVALLIGAGATAAATGLPTTTPGRAAIEKIVHEYIVSHPEVITEAVEELRRREATKSVDANRIQIETPFAGAWEGAVNPKVTLVEFFDYNCGYCRAALPVVDRLLKENPDLRVVYRDFPVLGPESESAARVSLAAAKAGKYAAFHRAIYAAGRPDPKTVERVAKDMGIPLAFATDPAAQAEIDANLSLARPLALSGTPSWVVGNQVLSGNVGYDVLSAAVAKARDGK